MKKNSVSLVDCTLREGNQAPKVQFTIEDSLLISKNLAEAGIDCIEIGHPYASQLEFDRVTAVKKSQPNIQILSHARAREEDILAVAKTGVSCVGIFAGVNNHSQKHKFKKPYNEIIKYINNSIRFAKEISLFVRYTLEDASRTDYSSLYHAYSCSIDAGADRICFADSVGNCSPDDIYKKISFLKNNFKSVEIEVHLHDDRGLAMANALAAISAGATHISCSVNGLGERCGITDTCALIANLYFIGRKCNANPELLYQLSRCVSTITKDEINLRRPVTGINSFTHTSKLHAMAVAGDPNCYQWINPILLGRH